MKALAKKCREIGATLELHEGPFDVSLHVDLPAGRVIHNAHGNCWNWGASDREAKARCLADALEWASTPVEAGCEIDDPSQCDTCSV